VARGGRRLRGALAGCRPCCSSQLLFLGYLLLSVVVLHWDEVTHAFTGSDSDGLVGYYFLGIPIAAWLLGRHVVRRSL
jgi:hypothetical protein